VPRGRGEHGVIAFVAWRSPILEARHRDRVGRPVGESLGCDRGEIRPRFDGGHHPTAVDQRMGRLPGAGSDLDDARAGRQATQLGHVVEDRLGIAGSDSLVQLGDRVEHDPVHLWLLDP
jgi:hypothetical protein